MQADNLKNVLALWGKTTNVAKHNKKVSYQQFGMKPHEYRAISED